MQGSPPCTGKRLKLKEAPLERADKGHWKRRTLQSASSSDDRKSRNKLVARVKQGNACEEWFSELLLAKKLSRRLSGIPDKRFPLQRIHLAVV